MLREQEIVQLRKGLMTPYVTNGPQIDYPDGHQSDYSMGMCEYHPVVHAYLMVYFIT